MRIATVAALLALNLLGCSSPEPAQALSRNDLIEVGIVEAGAGRAGVTGVPVELISIISADHGAFKAVLSNESMRCNYTIQGRLQDGTVELDKEVRQECSGTAPIVLVADVLPRNKPKEPQSCKGSERERLMCFTETHEANRALVLAVAG